MTYFARAFALDPKAAVNAIDSAPPHERPDAIEAVVTSWWRKDPATLRSWIDALPVEERDPALFALVKNLGHYHQAGAEEVALAISSPEIRKDAENHLHSLGSRSPQGP